MAGFNRMRARAAVAFMFAAVPTRAADDSVTTRPTLYVVGTAHLDTQWLWTIQDSIDEYVPNTLNHNFARFEKFPDYVFSFEGAFRYMLAKEYQPAAFERLKSYIATGRWHVCGSAIDAGDVNIPSPEALIRQILYGNGYFRRAFGKTSCDIFLPDCFGFGYALPAVAAHCGLKGFSTQKLTWGSSVGIPFDIGVWEGVDGSTLIAALNPGDYVSTIREDLSKSREWLERINATGRLSGAYVGYKYFGVGDQGGAPDEESVAWLEKSIKGSGPIRVVSAAADQLFRDLTPEQASKLPRYKGELLMTRHGTGCYTSQTILKRWNRRNEQLADAAERAAVAADWLGGLPYPRETLREAWVRLLWHHHHDDLTGTSIPQAYTFSWNDEVICLNQFAGVLTDSVGAVSGTLDTQVEGIPLVVFNPLSIEREDIVEATVRFAGGAPKSVRVVDPSQRDLPAQLIDRSGDEARILFLASVPAVGFAVFDVRPADAESAASELRVSTSGLENARYRVAIDRNGDVASIYDKAVGRELLAGPKRLELLNDVPDQWPEWEIRYQDVAAPPRGYVAGPAVVRVIERGPARVAVEIVRDADGSTFVQRIRLAAGGAGDRVEFDNRVDWHTRGRLLKAAFRLAAANPRATYDLGLGTIERGNNTDRLYEVPAQQWADLTDADRLFGVAVINDCKYGWDKPDDRTLRLSLIHSPPTVMKDLVTHRFLYAVAGHKGDWRSGGVPWIAAKVNQPLAAFIAPKHPGPLGRRFSLASVSSPQVAIRAIKKSEEGDEIIVRVQELHGRPTQDVRVSFAAPVVAVRSVDGAEQPIDRPISIVNGTIRMDLQACEPRSFALSLAAAAVRRSPTQSEPLTLPPYDADVISSTGAPGDGAFDRTGCAIPAELWAATITSGGVTFRPGSSEPGNKNAIIPRGQTLDLRSGDFNRLHFLAAAESDLVTSLKIAGRSHPWRVQRWTGDVGQWQSLVDRGNIVPPSRMAEPFIKRDRIAWVGSHRHDASGHIEPYVFCQLYRYDFPLPAGAAELQLPDDDRIRILAMTATRDGNDAVDPAGELYDFVLAPRIHPAQHIAIHPIDVSITVDDPAAEIRYTLDGSEPTRQSRRFTEPIRLTRDATVRARAFVGARGNDFVSSRSYRFVQPRPPVHRTGTSAGLSYAYYEGAFKAVTDLERATARTHGTIDEVRLPPGSRGTDIGVVFTGYLQVPRTGIYTLRLRSDDGSRLFIGPTEVIDNDGLHGALEGIGSIALAAGLHPIRLPYFQREGDAVLGLKLEGPGLALQSVPPNWLLRDSGAP